jgi:stage III sporulation protein AG
MDLLVPFKKLYAVLGKYRYVVLVLVIGIVLLVIPAGRAAEAVQPTDELEQEVPLQTELSAILSKVHGAGKVEVILTVSRGETTLYQTDESVSVSGDSSTTKTVTVTVTDAQRNNAGLIKQIVPPVYQGAIVVCEGADSPTVRLSIVDAVSKITGLGADKIAVLKMK